MDLLGGSGLGCPSHHNVASLATLNTLKCATQMVSVDTPDIAPTLLILDLRNIRRTDETANYFAHTATSGPSEVSGFRPQETDCSDRYVGEALRAPQ
jgi:hypothetical protein